MTIILTIDLTTKLFPRAPKSIVSAFVAKQHLIAEILASNERFAICIGNLYAETSGYALAGLTEDIWYSQTRMAHVWPNRFHNNAAEVAAKYGTAPGWQDKAFDDIYGDRMGNRPGTHDGSALIGRGGPQLTGLDEYRDIGALIGVDLVNNPTKAADPNLQPDILGAYWKAKKLSAPADRNEITEVRKIWNGGTNGLATAEQMTAKSLAILKAYVQPATAAPVVAISTATKDLVLVEYQNELIEMGYHEIGEADGLIGGKTRGAITAFFNDRNIQTNDSYPSQTLTNALNAAHQEEWHRSVSPDRAFATTTQLAPKIASVAPTARANLMAKVGAWFGAGTATAQGVMTVIPTAHDTAAPYIAMLSEYWDKVPHWVPFSIVGAVAFAIYHQTNQANNATTAAYQQGKIN